MTGRSPDTGSLRQDAPVFQPLPASPDGARANALIGAFLPVLTGAAGAAVGLRLCLADSVEGVGVVKIPVNFGGR